MTTNKVVKDKTIFVEVISVKTKDAFMVIVIVVNIKFCQSNNDIFLIINVTDAVKHEIFWTFSKYIFLDLLYCFINKNRFMHGHAYNV